MSDPTVTATSEPGYALVTPCRNEAAYLERVVSAIAAQRLLPGRWVLVDDGSTDGTGALLSALAAKHPFVEVLRRPDRGHDAVGSGVVEAMNLALPALLATEIPYLGKLDADVEVDPDYFHDLVAAMDRDPRLGIVSGENVIAGADGGRQIEPHAAFHPVGGARLYRRRVLSEIGGLVPIPGWDSLDVLRARIRGYRTRVLPGLQALHLRPMGTRGELRTAVLRQGRASWLLGYHPLYLVARAAAHCLRRPYLRRGGWLLAGYLAARRRKEPRAVTAVEMRHLRRFQLERLLARGE
jgi:poly-beta-1,6-N-acetyl-D-glucosamine synthase